MAAIEINVQSSPVLSSPNVGAASARSGSPQVSRQPVAIEQNVQQNVKSTERKVSEQEVRQQVAKANVEISGSNENISFGYEAKLGQLYVQVTDAKSGEVIREIPSKDFIQHRVAMREMIGLLLDKKA
ncbi:MAG: flagellar protein FlaG [Mariprofundaceae bacterium]